MTGHKNRDGRGFGGSGYVEKRRLENWSRENFTGSAAPRDTPLTGSELGKAADAIENMIIKGSRNPREAQGLINTYRATIKRLDGS